LRKDAPDSASPRPINTIAPVTGFLLIHGAFGGAWCWEPVAPRLRDAGHEAEAIDLPGAGGDTTPWTEVDLGRYAERICHVLRVGPPRILVGQSMGGMAITQAAARCPEQVLGLIYVSAFVPQDGQSLIALTQLPEAAGDQVQASLVVDGDPPIARMPPLAAPAALYNCATEEQAAWAAQRLGPQPVAAFAQPFELGDGGKDFATLPRAYISCLQDRAIMPAMQRRMYTAAGCDPVIEIDTDHSPWLSRTGELVDALLQIADAFGVEALFAG
jgi:pimeloyl-ACP methyl ester carboxylesterase